MQVQEFMTQTVSACVPNDSCAAAGDIMRRRQCGFVPVVDGLRTKRVVGVVTGQDIALHLTRLNRSPSHLAVKTCMTHAPETISAEASLEEAVDVMKRAAVRWLAVVNRGKLVGVLGLQDLALAGHRQWAYIGPHVMERHVMEVLEAIAVARKRRRRRS